MLLREFGLFQVHHHQRCERRLICQTYLPEDKSDKLVGAHIFGDDAPEIIQTLAIAFKAGAKKSHLDETMAVHPTGAEELVLMRKPSRTI